MRLAWLPCLLAGCGAQIANGADAGPGGKGDGTGGSSPLTPSAFLTRLGTSECDEAFTCRASYPASSSKHFEDEWGSTIDECYAGALDYFMPHEVEADVAAGKITFDANAARACLSGLDFGSCSQFWQHGPQFPAACGTALEGTVPDGGTCNTDFECAGGDVCDPDLLECTAPARRDVPSPRALAAPRAV